MQVLVDTAISGTLCVDINQIQIEDDYEDFGYEVKNAKRFKSRAKRTAKFKDYDDFD